MTDFQRAENEALDSPTNKVQPTVEDALLDVVDLRVTFPRRDGGDTVPVDGISFSIGAGERVGLVGESGSGKSLTALALMGLIGRVGGRIDPATRIDFKGKDLAKASEAELRQIRGGGIAMIFQDPLTSLNPVHKVGRQIVEAIELHRPDLGRGDARALAVDLLRQVKLRQPDRLVDAYPHELSGGMRQRVMIAMALAGDPSLLVADEPTTALDVTIQAEILDLLHELGESRGLAVLLITHDLGIVAGFTHRVMVMYGGRLVETAPTEDLYERPRHPYTAALLGSIPLVDRREARLIAVPGVPPEPADRPAGCVFHPRCNYMEDRCCEALPALVPLAGADGRSIACVRHAELDLTRIVSHEAAPALAAKTAATEVLMSVDKLSKHFRVKGERMFSHETLTAFEDVSFEIFKGEALGIVGESGSGKTTLVRSLVRLVEPSSGAITFRGEDLLAAGASEVRRMRRDVQMVFQDPGSSLDSRMLVGDLLAEPLKIHGLWRQPGYDLARLEELLALVQLPKDSLERYPHQFSGGQRQRIAIARALTLRPTMLVCDEPVSALDVSVRSSILNLLADLRDELDLTLVFIAHDLALVRFLCERVGVMYQGHLVELASNEQLFSDPQHHHTKALLAAQPVPMPAIEREQRLRRRRLRRASADAALAG